jgi:hypothetical protein
LEPVKEAVSALATSMSLQGDILMTILDKSLPTAAGLGGEFMLLIPSQMQPVRCRTCGLDTPACCIVLDEKCHFAFKHFHFVREQRSAP